MHKSLGKPVFLYFWKKNWKFFLEIFFWKYFLEIFLGIFFWKLYLKIFGDFLKIFFHENVERSGANSEFK
jgi:hypothetical protein